PRPSDPGKRTHDLLAVGFWRARADSAGRSPFARLHLRREATILPSAGRKRSAWAFTVTVPAMLHTLLTVLLIGQAQASPADELKANYIKYEFRIAMRDGKKLFTAVYVPRDDSQKYPILLRRTPYSCAPYGVDRYPDKLTPSSLFTKAGYIFAIQDVRGR